MKRLLPIIVIGLLTGIIASCSSKKKRDDIITVKYEKPVPQGPISTDNYRESKSFRWLDRDYVWTIERLADDSAAVGAAKGTQTRVEKEIVAGTYERLHNKTLSRLIQKNLETVGGVIYDERERKLGEELIRTTGNPEDQNRMHPIKKDHKFLPEGHKQREKG